MAGGLGIYTYRGPCAAGGAGSGGGSINIFMKDIEVENGTDISSYINVSGGNGGIGSNGKFNANGGTGGTGSCNIGYITTGSYQNYYSNS